MGRISRCPALWRRGAHNPLPYSLDIAWADLPEFVPLKKMLDVSMRGTYYTRPFWIIWQQSYPHDSEPTLTEPNSTKAHTDCPLMTSDVCMRFFVETFEGEKGRIT